MTNVHPASTLEIGNEVARASWDAALRSGAQASAAMAEFAGAWARIYQDQLQQSADAARSLWENALRTQQEFGELGSRVLAENTRALAQSLDQIARTLEGGGERKAPEPAQTAEAGVRRREQAA
jgi:hypothetical protein